MLTRFSMAVGSEHSEFKRLGVFDGFVEVDIKLYIDPHLLEASAVPEMRNGSVRFREYFTDVVRTLKQGAVHPDTSWRVALKSLTFPEIRELCLGYSAYGTRGNAIGSELAKSVAETALKIVSLGVEDPEIFELIGLLEPKIGADRISDMTASILLEDLAHYSERMARELPVKTRWASVDRYEGHLPYDQRTGVPVILVPVDVLRGLPVAFDWTELDVIHLHNEKLRRVVNKIIGTTWREAVRDRTKEELRKALLEYPDLVRAMVSAYQEKPADPYDLATDTEGKQNWADLGREYAANYPLDLSGYRLGSVQDVLRVVERMCGQFKKLVEDNGLWQNFYNDDGEIRNEMFAQLLFFAVADSYCDANNVDLSREPNAGRGPVDFKVSRGYKARVTVEIKYSKHARLLDGYMRQLPEYNRAEQSHRSIFSVVKTGPHRKRINRLYEEKKKIEDKGERAPEILVVDARPKDSASKLKAVRI